MIVIRKPAPDVGGKPAMSCAMTTVKGIDRSRAVADSSPHDRNRDRGHRIEAHGRAQGDQQGHQSDVLLRHSKACSSPRQRS